MNFDFCMKDIGILFGVAQALLFQPKNKLFNDFIKKCNISYEMILFEFVL